MYPNILTRSKEFTKTEIMNVEGFSTKTSTIFIANLPLFKDFLSENSFLKYSIVSVLKEDKTTSASSASSASSSLNNPKPLDNEIIVMTGFRSSDLEQKIISLGGTVLPGITSKTTILIAKDTNENSSKIKKAKEMGISIISLNTFETTYLV
jgi:NAD-dependent DNA ligase